MSKSESHFSALLRLTRLETVGTPVQHRVMSVHRAVGTTERLLHVSTTQISSSLPKLCNLEKAERARTDSVHAPVERRDVVLQKGDVRQVDTSVQEASIEAKIAD